MAVFRRLAIAVHPLDRELAEELARHADIPIEALVAPPTPAAVTQASDGARVFPAVPLLLDSILFASAAAADQQGAAGLSHTALRAVVRAAFARARVLGLTVEEIDEAMAGSDGALLRDRPRA